MNEAADSAGRRMAVLRITAVITWLAVGAPLAIAAIQDTSVLRNPAVGGWLMAFLVFGAAFWLGSGATRRVPTRGMRTALLAVQTVAALTANYLVPMPFPAVAITAALLVIVAVNAATVLGARTGLAWVLGQSLLLLATYLWIWPWQPAVFAGSAYLGFQLFAMFAASVAMSEARARQELSVAHQRLLAAQALVSENAMLAERARILRDLHDVLGHHLAALSLTLETAANLTEGRPQELVRRAGGLSRLMLADIRAVVHEAGAEGPVDLGAEVRRLSEPLTTIDVRTTVDGELPPLSGSLSQTLLRCVQEFLTNTVKHSKAATARIDVRGENGGVMLLARDDGCGSAEVTPGSGLTGMRTRVEAAGGIFQAQTSPGQGFEVRAWLPLRKADS